MHWKKRLTWCHCPTYNCTRIEVSSRNFRFVHCRNINQADPGGRKLSMHVPTFQTPRPPLFGDLLLDAICGILTVVDLENWGIGGSRRKYFRPMKATQLKLWTHLGKWAWTYNDGTSDTSPFSTASLLYGVRNEMARKSKGIVLLALTIVAIISELTWNEKEKFERAKMTNNILAVATQVGLLYFCMCHSYFVDWAITRYSHILN